MHRSTALLFALGLLSGEALAQEREWTLDASDQEAYLIFGVADTDDVGVSLWCPLKKGVVNLYIPRPTQELKKLGRHRIAMTVKAGDETVTFSGKVDLNLQADTSSVEAEMPVTHPLLKALEKADRFTVTVDRQEVVFPLYDADVPRIVELCSKG